MGDARGDTGSSEMMDEINLNGAANGGNSSDDEVVVGEDEELDEGKITVNGTSSSSINFSGLAASDSMSEGTLNFEREKASVSNDMGFFKFEAPDNEDLFGDRPLPDWVGWNEPSDMQVAGSSFNPFVDQDESSNNIFTKPQSGSPNPSSPSSGESIPSNGSPTTKDLIEGGGDVSHRSVPVPSLFEEDVEFVGVELEGTEKAMEQALKEGIVGEAGPLKRNIVSKVPEKENSEDGGMKEFNDANYWRVDQEVAVLE